MTTCKEWNTQGHRPRSPTDPYGGAPDGAWLNRVHSFEAGDGAQPHRPLPALVPALRGAGLRHRLPDRRLLQARRGRHRAGRSRLVHRLRLCAWACPYGAREFDPVDGVMKKCTLCVDRIDNEQPARGGSHPGLRRACPTGARHFGDLGDPESAVSRLVAERGGFDLLPELGYKPVNKYLPPRAAATPAPPLDARAAAASGDPATGSDRCSPGSTACSRADAAMHPAYSVILFTEASGAGLGLIAWLALFALFDRTDRRFGWALAWLSSAFAAHHRGLLASTAHLGRPERAWRAFSQWRTSWLSREGVMAVATYVPAGILGIGWVFFESVAGVFAAAAALAIVCAIATLYTTGMIYASLRTIRQWHQPLTAPIYVALGLASGAVLLHLLLALFGEADAGTAGLAIALLVVAAALKWALLAAHRRGGARSTPSRPPQAWATSARCVRSSRRIPSPTTSCARWAIA